MSKKSASAANDVDDLLGDEAGETKAEAKPAKKAAKAEAKPAKKAAAKTEAKPAAKGKAKAEAKPAKKAAKAEKAEASVPADSPVRKALLKVRKATTYADFAEANGFNIRTVRRMARGMRDAGEIDLSKDGQLVYIKPAV